MWAFTILLFAAVTAAVPNELAVSGRQLWKDMPTPRIGMLHGNKTKIEDYPYLVSIMYKDYLYIAGTIVSESWVVTVTGAIDGTRLFDFSVIAATNTGFPGKKYQLKTLIEHENTGVDAFDFSYACVQIKDKFKFNKKIQPVKLPRNPPPNHTQFVVAGYGSTKPVAESDPNAQNWILEGYMNWLDTKVCKRLWNRYAIRWSERMVCAYNKGKNTLCNGDAGDGFVQNNTFYGQYVGNVGVDFCTSNAMPSILANIAPLSDWIKNITGAQYEDEF